MMVSRPLNIKAILLPHLSAIHEDKKQPAKHPAWRVDAMLADKSAAWVLFKALIPYLLYKTCQFLY
jgi:hypothetical protein